MSAAEFKDKANNYLKNKDYDNALKCYDEAVQSLQEEAIDKVQFLICIACICV